MNEKWMERLIKFGLPAVGTGLGMLLSAFLKVEKDEPAVDSLEVPFEEIPAESDETETAE